MNNLAEEIVIRIIQSILTTSSLYFIMALLSDRSQITIQRIKRYMVYSIITFLLVYFVLGARTFLEITFYIDILIVSFLFDENHIVDKIWKLILMATIEVTLEMTVNFFADWFYYNVWTNWIVYELVVGIVCCMITGSVLLLNKKFKWYKKTKMESIIFSKSEVILLCLLTVCAAFTICVACILYENRALGIVSIQKVIVWAYMTIICTTCVVLGVDKNIAQNYYQKVNELIDTQFRNQVEYYEKMEQSNKEIRGIKHDMKNHLLSMQSLLHNNQLEDLDKYIDEIRTVISKKGNLIRTGNTIVDAILNEKNAAAHEKNIDMDIKVGIEGKIEIEMTDLCIILSNSIDNAIEACERIEDEAGRKISIKCTYRAGYFIYEIVNSMKEEAMSTFKNKLLTIKKDRKNHGFGVGNIEQSVKKYKGELKTSAENFEFKLEVEINTKATAS